MVVGGGVGWDAQGRELGYILCVVRAVSRRFISCLQQAPCFLLFCLFHINIKQYLKAVYGPLVCLLSAYMIYRSIYLLASESREKEKKNKHKLVKTPLLCDD